MTTITSTQLTEGQQGVLRAYDKDIAHLRSERNACEDSGDYGSAHRVSNLIEQFIEERAKVLAFYMDEAAVTI